MVLMKEYTALMAALTRLLSKKTNIDSGAPKGTFIDGVGPGVSWLRSFPG